MQKNVGKFDVSMYDEQVPNVFAAKHNLLQDLASLQLRNCFPDSEQHSEIKAVAIVLHHVNVRLGFDGVVQFDTVF